VADITERIPKDSWLYSWLHVWPHAEAPQGYILMVGLSMLGAAIGRHAWMDQDVHRVWPMLNLLLIGPSGIGKSTTLGMGRMLLEAMSTGAPQIIAGTSTPEKLHEDLAEQPHAVLIASELAAFFNKQRYNEALVPYVTELLDYRPVERRTRQGGVVKIPEHSVTVLGCSTVEWLQEQLPDSATTGGFLARFFVLNEHHKHQRVALPGQVLGRSAKALLAVRRSQVVDEFPRVVAGAKGAYDFRSYADADAFSLWYSNHKPPSGHLAPFAARAREFVLRMSMLIAVSRRHRWIEDVDVRAAISIYEYGEARLQEVVVPLSPQGRLLMRVLDVMDHPMTGHAIKRAMRNQAMSPMVQQCLDSLLESKDIERIPDGRYKRTENS